MGKFRTRRKQALDEKSPNSLVLRFTCKASLVAFSSTLVFFYTNRAFCKLLAFRENEKNFTQISDELGFSSIHYFSRLFKKKTGMTLTEYRSSVIYPNE